MNKILKDSYIKCRDIFKKYAKTYYLGAILFEKTKFYHISAFYAFARVIDNIVDVDNTNLHIRREKLLNLETLFLEHYKYYKKNKKYLEVSYDNTFAAILPAVLHTFTEIKIDDLCIRSFFNSMRMDLYKFRYKNYKELEEYMYGSAEIIGEVMYSIMEKDNIELLDYAYSLGTAFQLTNFIRDIREDYEMKPMRIYIPIDEQEEYNVNLELDIPKIIEKTISDEQFKNVKKLIKFEIERCDKIYDFSQVGIDKLKYKKSINLSKVLYQSIHNKIIENDYDVFNQKCNLSIYEKLSLCYQYLGLWDLCHFIFNYIRYSYFF